VLAQQLEPLVVEGRRRFAITLAERISAPVVIDHGQLCLRSS